MTGILRISKESLFSGLNNLEVYTILRKEYVEYFGFTEEEVTVLMQQAGGQYDTDSIKDWYNGYSYGGLTLYNSWSIVSCLKQKGALLRYWVNTSENVLIGNLFADADRYIKQDLEQLLQTHTLTKIIDENIVFGNQVLPSVL